MRKPQLSLAGLLLMVLIPMFSWAQTPPPGMTGQALRDWIKVNFYDGSHTTLGYSTARMYMYNYIDNDNNSIICVYSGFVQPWTYGGTGTNPAPINCEHTVPQSFFGSAEPMRSDIHHLFPTYGNWNSTRSNYPFADIPDNTTTKWMRLDQSQATIPTSNIDEYSEYANLEFEPREDHKGDAARAIFYFYTMYPTQAGPISSVADINTLYQWHLQDPPDADEVIRNDGIETYQGNRNPYVDNPDWVADAWELSGGSGAPAAPTNLALASTSNSLNLSWTDVSAETGYYVYKSTDNTNYTQYATLSANTINYSDVAVSTGTTYYYYVTAFNGNGESSGSNIVSGQPSGGGTGGPATELFLSEYIEGSSYNKAIEIANFTGAAVNLSSYSLKKETNGGGSWDTDYPLSGTLADGDVFVIAHSSADPTILAQADVITGGGIVTFNGNDALSLFKNGTLIDIIGVFNSGTNYAQDVTLVRKSSISSPNTTYDVAEWDSYATNTFSDLGMHTFDGGTTIDPPAAPSNFQLTATTTSLDLSWDDLADETGYNLYRSSDNVNFTQIANLAADVVSYSDNSVTLLATYYYYLEGYNDGGVGVASATVSGATLPTPPATPTNLELIATTVDLNLMWDDVTDEDGYFVYRSDDNVNFSQIASLGVDENTYTDNTVQLLTTYYYYVLAHNVAGNSGNSNVVSGQTESTTTGPATDLFISEYIEGSSYNKAIEIANFTGAPVDLSAYSLKKETNGGGTWDTDYPLSGTLADGDVYVIANSAADPAILAVADVSTGGGIVTFNGNDALALFKNASAIDVVGQFNSSATYAQDVTLVRKSSISSPNTSYTTSEWDSYASNTFGDLGSHTYDGSGGTGGPTASELFLSEYIEGSQNNKAIEIANFTGATVDLTAYSIRKQTNGSGSWQDEFFLNGSLGDGNVYVVGHSSASGSITSVADALVNGGVMSFNGNDPIGLFKNGTLIDIIGNFNGGKSNFGRNVTLVRIASVTGPNTTYTTAEWDAYGNNTFSFLGAHDFGTPGARTLETRVDRDQLISETKAWPNSFNEALMVGFTLATDAHIEIDMVNMTGQKVKPTVSLGEVENGYQEAKIHTAELPTGIYMILIRTGDEQQVIRVIKQ